MSINDLPRICLGHLPTPLEPLDRLSNLLGGPRIWVKRDDATGLATGGNKTRKLEFLIADALGRGADTVITVGAMQSNHARQTAAAAAKVGLRCELLLENRHAIPDPAYETGGNVIIDRLLGAEIMEQAEGTDLVAALEQRGNDLIDEGHVPYLVPLGGSNAVGALGYVDCAFELLGQAAALGLEIDHVVHATASAGTQAGLVAGFAAAAAGTGSSPPVTGISAGMPAPELSELVFGIACEAAAMIGAAGSVDRSMVVIDDSHVGPGYGLPTDAMREAVRTTANLEALILDPVYTGKAMAGLFEMARTSRFNPSDNVVFVHTGGVAGLLAYGSVFARQSNDQLTPRPWPSQ